MSAFPATVDPMFLRFAVAFALAFGLFLAGWLSVRRNAGKEIWPAVEGVVVESTVDAQRDGRQLYRPVVRYRYEVGGERFEGSRIQWAASAGYRKYTRARKILDSYRPGRLVKVHYDPLRPGVAVLRPGRPLALRPMLVIAPTAAMVALFVAGTALVGQ
jgi:hypothetical protein